MESFTDDLVRKEWITLFGREDEMEPYLRERLWHGFNASLSLSNPFRVETEDNGKPRVLPWAKIIQRLRRTVEKSINLDLKRTLITYQE
jgi:hypothetical protein